jgi:hypothetical protein
MIRSLRTRSVLLVSSLALLAGAACSTTLPEEKDPRPPGLLAHPEQVPFLCVTPGCDTTEVVQVDVVGPRRVAIKRIFLAGDAAADFTVTPSEQAPFIVGANSNFLVELRYLPLGAPAPGTVELRITYTDASPEESDDRLPAGELVIPLLRRLVGEPLLAASPGSISFGVVAPGSSAEVPLQLSNAGFGNIALQLAGVTSGHPDVRVQLPAQAALGPGQTLELPVRFGPEAEAYVQTELVLTASPGYVKPVKVSVEGTSLTTPRLALKPSSAIDFGEVKKGAQRLIPLVLMNQGGAALTVSSVQVVDASGAVTVQVPSATPFTLAPLEKVTLQLRVQGAEAGLVDARLQLGSDDPLTPDLELAVTGTITEPRLGLTPQALDFGNVPVGWVLTEPVELRNTGYGKLTVKHITLVAGSSSLFTLTQLPALPLSLEREGRTAVDVQFSAETAATFNGWLSVETDDPVNPFLEVPLTATAGNCASSCSIANGTPSCSGGTCGVGTCNTGWYDTDKQAANGCECKEVGTDPGAFCTGAHNLGTLVDNDKTQVTYTGVLPIEGDEDVIRFFAEDAFTWGSDNFKVKVRLSSSDPTIRMCVYRHDGGQSAECYWNNESCPTNREYEKGGSSGGNDDANFLVKVSRNPGAAPTCTTYTLFISNGL